MSNIKKILISAVIALVVIVISISISDMLEKKDIIVIPVLSKDIEEGAYIKEYISFVQVKKKNLKEDVFSNIAKGKEIENKVALKELKKGEIILKDKISSKEEYIAKVQDYEYISLPIKSATEAASYRIKKGDRINVYYTAKRKAVDNVLKEKIKIYSSNKEEAMLTCLLYQNVEVIAITNNMGIDTTDGTATDILVRLKKNEVLEYANLKEQGVFTFSLT